MRAKFLHIDINSYFATILQQENPFLRGKPVGVVKGKGRTCIIAASKEAKKYGVSTGCTLNDAKKLCKNIIVQPAQLDLYMHTTKILKKIFEQITPDAEVFSLDEAFIPLENLALLYPDPYKLALNIQEQIKIELGSWVTCNIGLAPTKLMAKIAGEIAPKGTILVVDETNREEILRRVAFKDVCGIGRKLEQKLETLDVRHPYDLNAVSEQELNKMFGPFLSKELKKIATGESSHILDRLDDKPYMKSVGRSITGYRITGSETEIKAVIYNLTEEVCFKLRQMDLAGRHMEIYLSGENKLWHEHKTFKDYFRHTDEVFKVVYHELYKDWKRDFKIIKFGVRISLLKHLKEIQPTLFSNWYKKESLYNAKDKLWHKYGLFSVHSGIINKIDAIKPEVTGFLGDKEYQFRD